MFANYVRLIAFAAGLLAGVQAPGFVDQYAKRVSAHHIEVARNFSGFQETANRYFGGSVEALIAHHNSSPDQAFHDEATSIRAMYDRLTILTAELAVMRGPLIGQMIHVVFRANAEILDETRAAYSYTVPLNPAAIVSGVSIGALLALLIELLLIGGVRLVRPRPDRSTSALHLH
jgi:hypothetical protein